MNRIDLFVTSVKIISDNSSRGSFIITASNQEENKTARSSIISSENKNYEIN